jgi:triacylglycerol lipase
VAYRLTCRGLTGVVLDRLAPEAPWPATIHDSWETLLWATSIGKDTLNLDLRKIAIGGASSGANIAAVIVQNAAVQQCTPLRSQFLIVPVTDNTATPCSKNPTWKMFEHTAALPAKKMLWYRNHYLPDPATWSQREASPLLAPDEIFRQLPRANIIVGELDVLRHEGEEVRHLLPQQACHPSTRHMLRSCLQRYGFLTRCSMRES